MNVVDNSVVSTDFALLVVVEFTPPAEVDFLNLQPQRIQIQLQALQVNMQDTESGDKSLCPFTF